MSTINPAKLTAQNHSWSHGRTCPLCNWTYLDPQTGEVRYRVPVAEQTVVGWAEPPWGRCAGVALVCECQACFGLYWFHYPEYATKRELEKRKQDGQL